MALSPEPRALSPEPEPQGLSDVDVIAESAAASGLTGGAQPLFYPLVAAPGRPLNRTSRLGRWASGVYSNSAPVVCLGSGVGQAPQPDLSVRKLGLRKRCFLNSCPQLVGVSFSPLSRPPPKRSGKPSSMPDNGESALHCPQLIA
jgi:hypothetical protein